MADVYILFSRKIDKYYIGSCMDLSTRLSEHLNKKYSNAYTTKASDWELFYHISGLTYLQARSIESHIKKMKSKMYISDLKNFTEMSQKLIDKYK